MSKVSKAEDLRQQEIRDLGAVLETPQGRRVMYRLIEAAGVFKSSFSPDPYCTAFAEGGRNAGLKLFADITGEYPDHYLTMMREAKERNIEDDHIGRYECE